MRADDLHDAVGSIARILDQAEIRQAVDGFRAARGDDRPVAAARLGHAGAIISERFQQLGLIERRVVKSLHLDTLANAAYWQTLLASASRPGPGNGEIVRLAARLMFASQNLPGLVSLLAATDSANVTPPGEGEARLRMRLADAGERASDPDRVARSIDGIDMLYSACASLTRRPAVDLRLEGIDGTDARDLHFTGGREAIGTVARVIDSIPGVLAELDEGEDIDLDDIVERLPVFDHLRTLAAGGGYSETDLANIRETMRQGALLSLESGAVHVDEGPARRAAPAASAAVPASAPAPIETLTRRVAPEPQGAPAPSAAESDRHYDEYLRERAAMQGATSTASAPSARSNGRAHMDTMSDAELGQARTHEPANDAGRRQANVEEMLAVLKQQRGK